MGILLTKLASDVLILADDARGRLEMPWAPVASTEKRNADCALKSVTKSGLLQVTCQNEVFTLPLLALREVRGIASDTARPALTEGLRLAVERLGAGNLRCQHLQIKEPEFLKEREGVICSVGSTSLASLVVFQGLAEAVPRSLLRAIYQDPTEPDALRDVERRARAQRRGLHSDAALERQTRQVSVQSWIAMLLGFSGSIAAFLIRARSEGKVVKKRVQNLLNTGRTALRNLIYEKEPDDSFFLKALQKLEIELAPLSEDSSHDKHFHGLRSICGRLKRNRMEDKKIDRNSELEVAEHHWKKLASFSKAVTD